ncbi:MAG TPA: hypothetical protein VKV04_12370, partial [Verrucomicrobiae bacterium]|nr:hypothetical protein [Verrucomicrobiae bacterium]
RASALHQSNRIGFELFIIPTSSFAVIYVIHIAFLPQKSLPRNRRKARRGSGAFNAINAINAINAFNAFNAHNALMELVDG